MKKIAVTGGSGRVGRAIMHDLISQGYEVTNIDIHRPSGSVNDSSSQFRQVELSDYGQTFAALYGFDAVIHLAANPHPDEEHFLGAQNFHNNTLATYNVFSACATLGIKQVVWASSITIYGHPFGNANEPDYVPIDEQHPYYPRSGYALSKFVGETLADHFARLHDISFVGLQFAYVTSPEIYQRWPRFLADPTLMISNLWSYVDDRDAAQAVRKSLQSDLQGSQKFLISANDSMLDRPTRDLLGTYFPNVSFPSNIGDYQSLFSSAKAKQILSFDPAYTWRDQI